MRVTYNTMYSNLTDYIDNNFKKISKTQEMISSGKKIIELSDAPLDATRIVKFNKKLKALNQYSRNITSAGMWLKTTDNALMQYKNLITKLEEITTQASTETYTYDQRQSLATNVSIIADNITQLTNTQINGKYIFSGFKVNTAPFETEINVSDDNYSIDTYNYNFDLNLKIKFIDSTHYKFSVDNGETWLDNNGEGYAINSVNPILGFAINSKTTASAGDEIDFEIVHNYKGDYGEFNIDIDKTEKLKVNLNGKEVFMKNDEKNIFKTLGKIWAGMITNNRNLISQQLDNLKSIEKEILSQDAKIGVKQNLLENFKSEFIEEDKEATQKDISELQDTDIAQAMTDLAKQQVIYQATLKTAAMVANLNILNFL